MANNFVVWFTGLPCSGKTTLARALAYRLIEQTDVVHLDGDVTRKTFGKDLGFSPEDRDINIERALGVAAHLVAQGTTVICSYISPYEAKRKKLRNLVNNSLIVWVSTPTRVCAERDVKGMWAKAKSGEIKGFTGIDDPYEEPPNAELHLRTDQLSVEESVQKLLDALEERGLLGS